MGTSQSRQNSITTKLYEWSREEFRKEYALIYTSRGRVLPSRSCTFYYRVNRDKVVFTMDDGLCAANPVRVNMEFVAVRDAGRRFTFVPVEFRESGTRFIERRRRSSNQKVLFFHYDAIFESRSNKLSLYKTENKQEYEVIFQTSHSDDYFMHNMKIACDPWNGIDVNLSGPYRHRSGERKLCDTEYIIGMPPDKVINDAKFIRHHLKIEDRNRVGAPSGPPQNFYYVDNAGNLPGDGNGCIKNYNDCIFCQDRDDLNIEDGNSVPSGPSDGGSES